MGCEWLDVKRRESKRKRERYQKTRYENDKDCVIFIKKITKKITFRLKYVHNIGYFI